MFAYFLFILILLASSLSAQTLPAAIQLESEKKISAQISGGTEHLYEINLSEGDLARVFVDQINVDVVMNLQEVAGEEILLCDQESRNQGQERFDFVVERSGKYSLVIRTALKNGLQGRYEIRLEKIRPAAQEDLLLFKSRQQLCQASKMTEDGNY